MIPSVSRDEREDGVDVTTVLFPTVGTLEARFSQDFGQLTVLWTSSTGKRVQFVGAYSRD